MATLSLQTMKTAQGDINEVLNAWHRLQAKTSFLISPNQGLCHQGMVIFIISYGDMPPQAWALNLNKILRRKGQEEKDLIIPRKLS